MTIQAHLYYEKSVLGRDYIITDGPMHEGRVPPGTNYIAAVKPISSEDHHQEYARLFTTAPALLDVAWDAYHNMRCNCGDICDGSCTHSMARIAIENVLGIHLKE